MKKLCILSLYTLSFITGFFVTEGFDISKENSTTSDILLNESTDAISYVKNMDKYKKWDIKSVSITDKNILHSYNISQTYMKDEYNKNPLDLNNDNKIDENDRIGTTRGVCQTIATLGELRYLHYFANEKLEYEHESIDALYKENIGNCGFYNISFCFLQGVFKKRFILVCRPIKEYSLLFFL